MSSSLDPQSWNRDVGHWASTSQALGMRLRKNQPERLPGQSAEDGAADCPNTDRPHRHAPWLPRALEDACCRLQLVRWSGPTLGLCCREGRSSERRRAKKSSPRARAPTSQLPSPARHPRSFPRTRVTQAPSGQVWGPHRFWLLGLNDSCGCFWEKQDSRPPPRAG